ncbi:phage gp6-like head-tail connector protein [Priestia filamentosa]|uniref:phage gp6-like head-tail connector protein n=1 Tax=Priestia filamentosa TaxID=1402861 RepID=UPI0039820523
MNIPYDLLEAFKNRMHITHSGEDSNLERLLSFSIVAIKNSCGEFDIEDSKDTDLRAQELVLERTRYAYNDALEYFGDNFLSEITSLSLSLIPEGDTNETL